MYKFEFLYFLSRYIVLNINSGEFYCRISISNSTYLKPKWEWMENPRNIIESIKGIFIFIWSAQIRRVYNHQLPSYSIILRRCVCIYKQDNGVWLAINSTFVLHLLFPIVSSHHKTIDKMVTHNGLGLNINSFTLNWAQRLAP